MQSVRRALAFSIQSSLAFLTMSILWVLCDPPILFIVIGFSLWAFCIGLSIVPETPEEIREVKNDLDRRFPWI